MSLAINVVNVLVWILAILLSVAILTLLERKLLASLQRRVGPDTVGILGVLQPIADAVKLVTKQTSSSSNGQLFIFYVAPLYALTLVIFAWSVLSNIYLDTTGVINLNAIIGVTNIGEFSVSNLLFGYVSDYYGWLTVLAILSLTVYAQLLLGWAANSTYAFMGSLRSSAALISYELILTTGALVPIICSQSYSLSTITLNQTAISYIIPLLVIFIIFIISTLAESSRVPFDLVEAESELVSGYMTEHASVAFTLLFLTEYASILLFSAINSILWIGCRYYTTLSLSIIAMLSIVILARALLPRLRYDQLIKLCWVNLLPVIFVLIIMVGIVAYQMLVIIAP